MVGANRVMELANALTIDRVDDAAGVLRGVKIVGVKSVSPARVLGLDPHAFGQAFDEPYSYDIDGLKRAIPLYENAKVFSNHTPYETAPNGVRYLTCEDRDNRQLVGWLSNVHARSDGLYGDLNCLKSDELTGKLIEAAKRNPKLYALSHEARWANPRLENGRVVLGDIGTVDCVAIVSSKPGTTAGLYEVAASHRRMSMRTLGMVLESCADTGYGKTIKRAIEAAPEMADMPVPVDDSASPDEAGAAGVKETIMAMLDTASPEVLDQIMSLLQVASPVDAEPAPSDAMPPPSTDDLIECMSQFTGAGVTPDKIVLETAMSMPSEKRQAYVKSIIGIAKKPAPVLETRAGFNKPAAPSKPEKPLAHAFDGLFGN